MRGSLVIIEATGKREALAYALSALDRRLIAQPATVVATKGHLFTASSIGIDPAWNENGYATAPERRTEIAAIQRQAAQAQAIYIATDDDAEGDVIARDVLQLIPELEDKCYRVRLRSLDRKAVTSAFSDATKITSQTARLSAFPGDMRRQLDRCIGLGLSNIDNPRNKLPVGRVFSSLLTRIQERPMTTGTYCIAVPAADGGKPFVANVPMTDKERINLAQLLPDSLPELVVQAVREGFPHHPWTYEQALSAISRKQKVSIAEAGSALQAAYESGQVSYPRSTSSMLSDEGLEVCRAIAARNGMDLQRLPAAKSQQRKPGAHEAIRPTQEMALAKLPTHDLVCTSVQLVTRQIMLSGQPYMIEFPDTSPLPECLQPFASLFMRMTRQSFISWREPETLPGWNPWGLEHSLLHTLSAMKIGGTGSLIKHVATAIQRQVVAPDGALTQRGLDLVAEAKRHGIDATFAQRAEDLLFRTEGLWDSGLVNVKSMLTALLPAASVNAIEALIADQRLYQPHQQNEENLVGYSDF